MLDTPNFTSIIKCYPVITPAQLLLSILKYAHKNSSAVTEIEQILAIVNNIFSSSVLFDSGYYIRKLCSRNDTVTFYKLCPKCKHLIGNTKELPHELECDNCKEKIKSNDLSDNVFALIDPTEAIQEYITLYEDHYDYVVKERQHEHGIIEDIYDGLEYRNFVNSLSHEDKHQYVTATLNTDGAQPFESNDSSVWRIYIQINELPLQKRLQSIITCGVWFGDCHPPEEFFEIYLKLMSNILKKGIQCTVKGTQRLLKVHIICSVADTPARPLWNCTINFHGYYSCDWCFIKGKYSHGCVRFPIENVMKPRDMRTTLKLMLQAHQKLSKATSNNTSILGIKKIAPLAVYAKKFNIIRGMVPDYLHVFLLGIGKRNFIYILKSMSV